MAASARSGAELYRRYHIRGNHPVVTNPTKSFDRGAGRHQLLEMDSKRTIHSRQVWHMHTGAEHMVMKGAAARHMPVLPS